MKFLNVHSGEYYTFEKETTFFKKKKKKKNNCEACLSTGNSLR